MLVIDPINMSTEKLNSNFIKTIAILAMTIDHLAWLLFPGFSTHPIAILMHLFGRLTAPIMWYFVAEGYYHTSSKMHYFLRLLTLAIISHFAFCFAFGLPYIPFSHGVFNQTSVIWSLALSIPLLKITEWQGHKMIQLLAIIAIITLCFPADWSCIAAVSILYFYRLRNNFNDQAKWLAVWISLYAIIYFLFIDPFYAMLQFGTLNSLLFLRHYNSQRGNNRWLGKFFYYYYPLHMGVIGILRIVLYGNSNILF